jgi:hypothetical protein
MSNMSRGESAEALQTRIQRELSGPERLKIAVEMSLLARGLSLSRLRAEHPQWSESELLRGLVQLAFSPDALPPHQR